MVTVQDLIGREKTSQEILAEELVSGAVRARQFKGPVRPGTDEAFFRETGVSQPAPPPTFESSLLQQSFGSPTAREQAEGEFRQQQRTEAESLFRQQQQEEAARGARIESEQRPSFFERQVGGVGEGSLASNLFSFPTALGTSGGLQTKGLGFVSEKVKDIKDFETIADVAPDIFGKIISHETTRARQLRLREEKRQEILTEFESLSPEQAFAKASAGEEGFTLEPGTDEGSFLVSFDPSKSPELKEFKIPRFGLDDTIAETFLGEKFTKVSQKVRAPLVEESFARIGFPGRPATFTEIKTGLETGDVFGGPSITFREIKTGLETGGITRPVGDIIGKGLDILSPVGLSDFEKTLVTETVAFEGRLVAPFVPVTPAGVAATGGLVVAFPFLSPALQAAGGVVQVGFSGVSFVQAEDIEGKISAGIGIGLGGLATAFATKPFIKGAFAKGSKTNVLGEKIFVDVPTGKKTPVELDIIGFGAEFKTTTGVKGFDKVDITLIPPGGQKKFFSERFDPKLKGSIEDIIASQEKNILFRDEPFIPKLTEKQQDILRVVSSGDDIITGSLARKIQLENQRQFKDIDIVAAIRREETASKILGEIPGIEVIRKQRALTIRETRTGIELVDIVDPAIAEAGFIQKFGFTEVGGVKIADPRAILGGKLSSLQQRAVGKTKEVLDISQITGGRLEIGPGTTGPFGLSFEQQLATAGERTNIAISARGFFESLVGDVTLTKPVFGTPSKMKDPFLLRESRLGLSTEFFKFPSPKSDIRVTFDTGKAQALLGRDILIETPGVSPRFLKELAKRADLGDEKAIVDILRLSKQFREAKSEGFVASAQRRGELEVIKEIGTFELIGRGRTIRVKGQAVETFEFGIGGKGKKPNFSKDLNNLLKESKQKGFENLVFGKQKQIFKSLKKETGFDFQREFGDLNIVSPVGIGSAAASAPLFEFTTRSFPPIFSKQSFFEPSTRKGFGGVPPRQPVFDINGGRIFPTPRPGKEIPTFDIFFGDSQDLPPPTRDPFIFIQPPPPPPTRKPPVTKPSVILGPRGKKKKTGRGWDVFGLKESTKPKKRRFVKLNKDKRNSLTKEGAFDLGSWAIDNSIAATFKVKRSKKPSLPLKRRVAKGHFQANKEKFRPRKRVGERKFGSQLPPRVWIERRGHRLDMPGEVDGITLARLLAPKQKKKKDKGLDILGDMSIIGEAPV